MYAVLFSMAALIGCGVVWRLVSPGAIEPLQIRKAIGDLVFYLLLPALSLSVLWRAPLDSSSFVIAGFASLSVFLGLALGWFACRISTLQATASGAIILACAFPNATYLGLPFLESLLGEPGRYIAVQYDLFACTPLLLTLGVYIAQKYGTPSPGENAYLGVFKVPALWAALLALLLNSYDVPVPAWLDRVLTLLGNGVAPFMLIALGLSLTWSKNHWRLLPSTIPVVIVKLALVPAVVFYLAGAFSLAPTTLAGLTLEAAMPSMVLGLVICERYGLNTSLYATAVTITTAFSMFTLTFWSHIVLP